METKICAKCKQELPLSKFRLYTLKGKKRPYSYCRECEHEKDRNKYKHICEECGKEYRSGRKTSKICKDCYCKKVGKMGAENLSKLDQSGENNPMYGVHRYGKDNPNYNHNITDEEREKGRYDGENKIWREKIYERDHYTCQCCGDNKGGNLNAHHLNGYNWDKDHRTDVNNGVTLCETCHKEFHHIYGYGFNTKEQFEEFIKNIMQNQ